MEKGCKGVSGRWRGADSEEVPGWGTGEPWEGCDQERPWTEKLEEEDGEEGTGPKVSDRQAVWGVSGSAQGLAWRGYLGKGVGLGMPPSSMFREGPQQETI